MLVVRRRTGRNIDRLQTEMEDIFHAMIVSGRTVRPRGHDGRPPAWRPPVEVYETDSALVVLVEIAGVTEELVDVTIDDTVLSVRGERSPRCDDVPRSLHEMGILYGAFAVDVYLPFAVESDRAQALYQDGLLKITLPRPAAKRISISAPQP
jgi:HSP20 family protein